MSRTQRLLDLMQILRERRTPISAQLLASKLQISLRTLYRDINTLREQGADIRGEPGLGYQLTPGFTLPPLMFTNEEISALQLGAQWVAKRKDATLSAAALSALAKISSVIPTKLRIQLETTPLIAGPSHQQQIAIDLQALRQSIQQQKKLKIVYEDATQKRSNRTIWPLALGYFEQVCILIAWCEKQQDFRHFRCDRIKSMDVSTGTYPEHRLTLLQKWKKQENIVLTP